MAKTKLKIMLCAAAVFLFIFCMGCERNIDETDKEPEITSIEFSDKGFATSMSNVFGKPASDITPEELSSVRFLHISYYDNACNVSVGFDDYYNADSSEDKGSLLKRTSVSAFSDFEDMKYFTGLRGLGLYEIYTFSDFGDLKDCKQLESLDIYTETKNKALTKLDGIEKLGTLKELDIYGAVLSDVSKIGSLKNLESLSVGADYRMYEEGDKTFSDISSFSNLTKLKSLAINYSEVKDISPIKDLGLTYLFMYRCALSDISDIESLTELEAVDLVYNTIEDVTPLTKLPKLRSINLDYNYVKDVSPFGAFGVDDIDFISMDMNSVSDWTPVRHLYEAGKLYAGYELYFE